MDFVSTPPFRAATPACSAVDKPAASLMISEDFAGPCEGAWAEVVGANSTPSVHIAIASRRAKARVVIADPARGACGFLASYIWRLPDLCRVVEALLAPRATIPATCNVFAADFSFF